MSKDILITGAAGFIGSAISKRLVEKGENIIGIDNMNDYYDVNLKKSRLEQIKNIANNSEGKWQFFNFSIENKNELDKISDLFTPTIVLNFAAQAGVRYSINNPSKYINTNLLGFGNILEFCRTKKVKNFIYASSSSVYGGNKNLPFKESQSVDHPISLYAATKKANEVMAHSYSHLFQIPSIGLRFFTVYGPWGRPDMALFLFTKSILEKEPINVFNEGNMIRDFTYIDDVVESLIRIINKPAYTDKLFNKEKPNPSKSWAPYRVFNIGNSTPTPLINYINAIEQELGLNAKKLLMPMQMGDVPATESDSSELESWIDFKPNTSIKSGIKEFVKWYKDFYGY